MSIVTIYSTLTLYTICCLFFFKQKTAYELRISDWSSDVCSSDLEPPTPPRPWNLHIFDNLGKLYSLAKLLEIQLQIEHVLIAPKIGRASCRERVCQYV